MLKTSNLKRIFETFDIFGNIFLGVFDTRDLVTNLLKTILFSCKIIWEDCTWRLACKNIRFFSFFAAGDVSHGGTSASQRQKFHTDDANQCLHNKSSSHGVPNINLSSFTCPLVGFGKVLCPSAKELQQNSNTKSSSREDIIPQILTVLLEILRVLHLAFVAFYLLSVIRKQQLKQCNYSIDQ